MVTYNRNSPYFKTPQGSYLDFNLPRSIGVSDNDIEFTITSHYNLMPQKLALEQYGSEHLYYIFALRNPDILKDPYYDFKTGVTIIIPSKEMVNKFLESNRNVNGV